MKETTVFYSDSPQQTIEIAKTFAGSLKPGDLVLYQGEMGAGKTYFTKGIAQGLGISDSVISPTFALVHEYEGGRIPLFHFDLFRITGLDDLYAIGFFDFLDRGGVIAAEWSENVPELVTLADTVYQIEIEKTGETQRKIRIGKEDVC
jgi:tRNA threonylcarbamoyladenosine biosynthesis protein TsaE